MREKTFIYVRESHLVQEKEVKTADIAFDNGKLRVNNNLFLIAINGDERNIPKAFVPSFEEDGFPRILCDWNGQETNWMLDDVTLYPVRESVEK
ncbi:hypothetical protein ACFVS2_25505 [Brevibacillus sp. NPDC058079]|uniref:hypothetical protein n=1 Tax=Brevibacillus sp. NPDC058079 TaxID=3346330 RepID=UPI0036E4BBFD